jgi:hypothetical protein
MQHLKLATKCCIVLLALLQIQVEVAAEEQPPEQQSPEQQPLSGQSLLDPGHGDHPGGAIDLTGYVVPVQMFKLTLAPADASNRLEINHFQPLSRTPDSILFFDNTVYGKARPFGPAGEGLPAIETWGESFRLGYRKFINGGRGYFGLNGGYDNALQQGYLYQQLGVGAELIFPSVALVATLTQGIGNLYYQSLDKSLLSSFNIQASFPTGVPGLAIAPRFYYVYDQIGDKAPGGQLELVYSFNKFLSVALSTNYDSLNGQGATIQFHYQFHPPDPGAVPAAVPYGIASPFSQAIGNTGSRIIRLTGSSPAYGN